MMQGNPKHETRHKVPRSPPECRLGAGRFCPREPPEGASYAPATSDGAEVSLRIAKAWSKSDHNRRGSQMTTQPRATASLGSFNERLGALLADLEAPDPADPKPSATRATVKYLRILQTCGPEEMIEAMIANVLASIAALKLLAPSYSDAAELFMLLAAKAAAAFTEVEQAKSFQDKRNPSR
jgi:hypothetical protein